MFELGAGLYRKGERRGELRGELKGERKGEWRLGLEMVKMLMDDFGCSPEEAVKHVNERLHMSEEEKKNFLKELETEQEKPYGVAHYAEEKNKEAKGPGQQQEVGR